MIKPRKCSTILSAVFPFFLPALCLLLSGCATMQQMYSGPKLPNDEVSVFNLARNIYVSQLDNAFVGGWVRKIECLPGTHKMAVNYSSQAVSSGYSGGSITTTEKTAGALILSFDTKAGHEYEIDGVFCVMSGGKVYSTLAYASYMCTNRLGDWLGGQRIFVPFVFDRTDCEFVQDHDTKRALSTSIILSLISVQDATIGLAVKKKAMSDPEAMKAAKELKVDDFSGEKLAEYMQLTKEKKRRSLIVTETSAESASVFQNKAVTSKMPVRNTGHTRNWNTYITMTDTLGVEAAFRIWSTKCKDPLVDAAGMMFGVPVKVGDGVILLADIDMVREIRKTNNVHLVTLTTNKVWKGIIDCQVVAGKDRMYDFDNITSMKVVPSEKNWYNRPDEEWEINVITPVSLTRKIGRPKFIIEYEVPSADGKTTLKQSKKNVQFSIQTADGTKAIVNFQDFTEIIFSPDGKGGTTVELVTPSRVRSSGKLVLNYSWNKDFYPAKRFYLVAQFADCLAYVLLANPNCKLTAVPKP